MFCTFISQYMLDVEFGIEKRRGYICINFVSVRTIKGSSSYIYADFVIEAQGGYMCLYMYMYMCQEDFI